MQRVCGRVDPQSLDALGSGGARRAVTSSEQIECARQIADAFRDYNEQFRAITRRASRRFDKRDWKASQADAVERIELYDRCVNGAVAAIKLRLADRSSDRLLWSAIRHEFATVVAEQPDRAFCKTFFSSVTRRLFGTIGVAPEIEFVATELDALPARAEGDSVRVDTVTYENRGSLQLLIEDLLGELRLGSQWRDFDKTARRSAPRSRRSYHRRNESATSSDWKYSGRSSSSSRGPISSARSRARALCIRWS